jgi:hypothetical protein
MLDQQKAVPPMTIDSGKGGSVNLAKKRVEDDDDGEDDGAVDGMMAKMMCWPLITPTS